MVALVSSHRVATCGRRGGDGTVVYPGFRVWEQDGGYSLWLWW